MTRLIGLNEIIRKQLENMFDVPHEIDGKKSNDIPKSFNEIVFYKNDRQNANKGTVRVEFENYIVFPFEGFDFHDKFNNGVPPYSKVMYGKILRETDKMYYFDLFSETSDKHWVGWCPKKSCKIS